MLEHFIMFNYCESVEERFYKMADDILLDSDLKLASKDARAKAELVIGAIKFMSGKIPYHEVKDLLKLALLTAEDLGLKSLIAHNLAVINYCEI